VPRVSVILPTCDRPALLPRAVESVLGQTEPSFELLLVDSNRRTGPLSAAKEAKAWLDDPRVRVLRSSSAANAAAARNVGLAEASGDWIAYLDDDDAYRPEKLGRQLAASSLSPIVLCGALYHLRRRCRLVQTSAPLFRGDDLLNVARWGTPFLMHRRIPGVRFDEDLFAGEDGHFAQAILERFNVTEVPVVAEPLIDVYQDRHDDSRTNVRAEAGWRASRRILALFGRRYSRAARRLYLLRAMVARAKLEKDALRCVALAPALLRAGGAGQIRYAVNAILVSGGFGRGRWVT
jgi:glycosyltransferase involved in cell wall biosynthesis